MLPCAFKNVLDSPLHPSYYPRLEIVKNTRYFFFLKIILSWSALYSMQLSESFARLLKCGILIHPSGKTAHFSKKTIDSSAILTKAFIMLLF